MKPYFQIILALLCSYSFCLISQESNAEDVPFDYAAQFVDYVNKKFHQSEKEQHDFDHNPLQLALSAECEPLTTVAGCVNVFSGHFFQIEKDLKAIPLSHWILFVITTAAAQANLFWDLVLARDFLYGPQIF